MPKWFHRAGPEYRGGREVHGTELPPVESFVEVYVVRAQFVLDRLPQAGDSVSVVHGHRMSRLLWP